MTFKLIYLLLFFSPALSRHVPRFQDLDEEDHHLFRAAYETPSYDQNDYEEDDLQLGKLDLVKDGLWAMKAKIKELKAFNKAFAANLLSTKMKLKELLKHHMIPLKIHQHAEYEKPSYNYQAPSYQAPSYQAPSYQAPSNQYGQYHQEHPYPSEPQYGQYHQEHPYPSEPQYAPPAPHYAAPLPQYGHDPYYGH